MKTSELIAEVQGILRSHCDDPIAEMRKMGQALIQIADALDGRSIAECSAIIESVRQMEYVRK